MCSLLENEQGQDRAWRFGFDGWESPRRKEVEVGLSRAELKQLGGVVGAEQLGERKVENRDVVWWGQREALDPELGLCPSSAVTLGVG